MKTALLPRAAGAEPEKPSKLLLPLSDPGQTDTSGMDALMRAALEGRADCMRELLPWSDPKLRGDTLRTLIFCAAVADGEECLQIALEALGSESIDERMGRGHTALMAVCSMGKARAAARLLAFGADPNLRPPGQGGTCMHLTVIGASLACAQALLGHVDLSILDSCGRTAAQVAKIADRHEMHEMLRVAEAVQTERRAIEAASAHAPSAPKAPRI